MSDNVENEVEETFAIESTAIKFDVKCAGETLTIDFSKMHPTVVEYYLLKAAQRRVNDDLSGLEPSAKLAEYRKILAVHHSGEKMERARRGTSGAKRSGDPIKELAMKNAKSDLLARFKKNTKFSTIAEFADVPAIAAFFHVTKDRITWEDETVEKYIAKQLETGERDYIGDAKTTLAAVENADDEVTDALADLF